MKAKSAKSIGSAIRQRRRELGLDQPTLARRIGASRQWVIAVEQGKDSAQVGRVLRALDALELSLDISANTVKPKDGKRTLPQIDIDNIINRARTHKTT